MCAISEKNTMYTQMLKRTYIGPFLLLRPCLIGNYEYCEQLSSEYTNVET